MTCFSCGKVLGDQEEYDGTGKGLFCNRDCANDWYAAKYGEYEQDFEIKVTVRKKMKEGGE